MPDQDGEREKKDRHRMFRVLVSVDMEDWKAFKRLVGVGNAPQVVRDFVAYFIGKPGAKMPRRPKPPE